MGESVTEGVAGEPIGEATEMAEDGFEADSEGDESGLPAAPVETAAEQSSAPDAPQPSAGPVEQPPHGTPGDEDPHHQ
jgi:hypothetical protein